MLIGFERTSWLNRLRKKSLTEIEAYPGAKARLLFRLNGTSELVPFPFCGEVSVCGEVRVCEKIDFSAASLRRDLSNPSAEEGCS